MLEKCVLTILELNWNRRLGHKKTKLNICHDMLTSSTQLQNRSFHVVERTRTSVQSVKKWKMHVQSVQKYCFSLSNMQICGILVAVVVVVAKLPNERNENEYKCIRNPRRQEISTWKYANNKVKYIWNSYCTAVVDESEEWSSQYFVYLFTFTSFHCTRRYEVNKLTSLPMCGFTAQLIEHRTGIAEFTGSNPVEALIFFRLLPSNCLNWKIYCDDHSSLTNNKVFARRVT